MNYQRLKSKSCLLWIWLAVGLMVLDQMTKYWAIKSLVLYSPQPVLPFFNLTLLHNNGAAFSFLSHTGSLANWLFGGFALLVSVGIIVYLKVLPATQRWAACALSLVLGGALGNLIDRIVHGYVIDFFDFYYGQWHFAAFNIADAAISVGAVMWFIHAFWLQRHR